MISPKMDTSKAARLESPRKTFERIAFWQFLSFLLLIMLIWSSVTMDFARMFYDRPDADLDWLQASILTAGVIVVGFITIAHAYLQQRRMLHGFITVCSYCRKVQVENNAWQQIESYVAKHSAAEFTHGVCPSCYEKVLAGKKPG
jgi:hypothetical protein